MNRRDQLLLLVWGGLFFYGLTIVPFAAKILAQFDPTDSKSVTISVLVVGMFFVFWVATRLVDATVTPRKKNAPIDRTPEEEDGRLPPNTAE